MKYTFCAIMFVLSAQFAKAADEWKVYLKSDKVTVMYRYEQCNDKQNGIYQEKILLKFVNLTDKPVEVIYAKDLVYDNLKPATGDTKQYTVTVSARGSTEGDCSTKDPALFIFSKHLDLKGSELKRFDLKDLLVK